MVAATDFVRKYPALQKRLIAELPLVVPFIWVHSLAQHHGRGRFGYRPAWLLDALISLRGLNPETHLGLVDSITIAYDGEVFLDLPAIGRAESGRAWWRALMRPPAINTASKLAQERWCGRLVDVMTSHGLAAAELHAVIADKEW